ncbi:MAG: hypothetical protein IJ229_00010 [Clostridia bacterium]|nr:hypothetical protein [Clostridia bacterium]
MTSPVRFSCEDPSLQTLFDRAQAQCEKNLRRFGPYTVLVEGGGYEKLWLETQPMGGEMYALRSPEAAYNNIALFMRYQREDGRLPGSIRHDAGTLTAEYNKYQGFCFPYHALNLYYLLGEDRDFLDALRTTLIRFDACLWRTRHVSGDGILSSFCVYDTGEDHALRYGDAPVYWTEDTPPEGSQVVPMASMDVTGWSYAARDTLAAISRILNTGEAEVWAGKAREVAVSLRERLWDDKRGALYDRDRFGRTIDILCHNTLRCMYWGSVSPEMARRFLTEHLRSPKDFWTPFPLPSIAVSDPAFRNAPENNWSGQSEGLTWQRSILALERYGFRGTLTELGKILFRTIADNDYRFVQQYDPLTGKASLVDAVRHEPIYDNSDVPVQTAYGPTLLAALGFIDHLYGICGMCGKVAFSLAPAPYTYECTLYGHIYRIESSGKVAALFQDSRQLGVFPSGTRIVTDKNGQVLSMHPMTDDGQGCL